MNAGKLNAIFLNSIDYNIHIIIYRNDLNSSEFLENLEFSPFIDP